MLLQRTQQAYDWINKYLNSISTDRWDETPPVVDSNVSWQLGHLTLSAYFHAVLVIKGHQPDILQAVPIKDYSRLYHRTAAREVIGQFSPEDMLAHWSIMQTRSLEIIGSLTEEDLESPLVPTDFPHPVANIKREALEWNILHNHYHFGQLGLIRRVLLGESYDYFSGNLRGE